MISARGDQRIKYFIYIFLTFFFTKLAQGVLYGGDVSRFWSLKKMCVECDKSEEFVPYIFVVETKMFLVYSVTLCCRMDILQQMTEIILTY